MKSIQKVQKNLTAKIITNQTLAKITGGASITIVNPDDLDG